MVKKRSFKYFIGYNDKDDIRPLCIKIIRMIGYAKYFAYSNIGYAKYVESNKTMYFKVTDKKLLKKYIKILKKFAV